jgi:UDP-glucose 4-epimerase
MEAAKSRRVSRVVMLSTYKSFYPINAMGISKAMMEKFMGAKARNQKNGETIFCATR